MDLHMSNINPDIKSLDISSYWAPHIFINLCWQKKHGFPAAFPAMWCPRSIAKLVQITLITRTYGRYINS